MAIRNRTDTWSRDTWSRDLNSDFPLKDCSIGGVKLAKNADPDKFLYSGYVTGFNFHSEFHYLMVAWVKMSSF